MKRLKSNSKSLLLSLLEIVVGILLLINPIGFTTVIIVTIGVLLLISGIVSFIQYFRSPPEEGAAKQLLFKALILFLFGAACSIFPKWFISTFPLLTVLYGVLILLTGLAKIQWTVDMIRAKKPRWYLTALGAILSVACAAVIFIKPFSTTAILWMFTGISLIAEAIVDIALLIASRVIKAEEKGCSAKAESAVPANSDDAQPFSADTENK